MRISSSKRLGGYLPLAFFVKSRCCWRFQQGLQWDARCPEQRSQSRLHLTIPCIGRQVFAYIPSVIAELPCQQQVEAFAACTADLQDDAKFRGAGQSGGAAPSSGEELLHLRLP